MPKKEEKMGFRVTHLATTFDPRESELWSLTSPSRNPVIQHQQEGARRRPTAAYRDGPPRVAMEFFEDRIK